MSRPTIGLHTHSCHSRNFHSGTGVIVLAQVVRHGSAPSRCPPIRTYGRYCAAESMSGCSAPSAGSSASATQAAGTPRPRTSGSTRLGAPRPRRGPPPNRRFGASSSSSGDTSCCFHCSPFFAERIYFCFLFLAPIFIFNRRLKNSNTRRAHSFDLNPLTYSLWATFHPMLRFIDIAHLTQNHIAHSTQA